MQAKVPVAVVFSEGEKMATKWFYQVEGEEVGPVSARELKSLAQSGALIPDSRVKRDCDTKWVPARRVKGLFRPAGEKSARPPSTLPQGAPPLRPAVRVVKEPQYDTIGGWLLIPAIGLVGGVIMGGFHLAFMLFVFGPELSRDRGFWVLWLMSLVMFFAQIVVTVLFFQKRRIAIPAVIGLLVAGILLPLVVTVALAWETPRAPASEVDTDFLAEIDFLGEWTPEQQAAVDALIEERSPSPSMFEQIIGAVLPPCICAAIWIPYFLKSERVKNTFVN